MTALWRLLGRAAALRFLAPAWRPVAFLTLGMTAGAGLFVLHVSRAASYLSDAPETCANCHVMTTQYVTWQHSSHAGAATCNDCHVPHDTLASQYAFKARDGLWHATVFTMRWEPQVIRLSQRAVPVVEENCRRCHARVIEDVSVSGHAAGVKGDSPIFADTKIGTVPAGDLRCWECHREVPHGSVRSLSTTPGIFQPQLPPVEAPGQQPRLGGRPLKQ